MAANTLIALVVVTTAGVASYLALQAALYRSLDDALAHRADFAAELDEAGEDPSEVADRLSRLGIRAHLLTPDQATYVAEPLALRVPRTAAPGRADHWRSIERILPSGTSLTLEISTYGVDHTLERFRSVGTVIGLAAVLATAMLTAVASRVTLAPLRSVARIARSITAGDVNARVRPHDPETEVGQVAAAFDEMVDHLQAANAALERSEARSQQLVADVAHQLRTPLAGVLATTEILRDRRDPTSTRELLDAAHRSAARAAHLTERLLGLAHLELPARHDDCCDAAQVVADVTSDLSARNPHLNFLTELAPGPVPAPISASELEDAVTNIVDNAVRHARAQVTVRLMRDSDKTRITIHDDGPGLDPTRAEEAFGRFTSLDGHGGTGLGLAIARAALRRRGGDVTWQHDHFRITI